MIGRSRRRRAAAMSANVKSVRAGTDALAFTTRARRARPVARSRPRNDLRPQSCGLLALSVTSGSSRLPGRRSRRGAGRSRPGPCGVRAVRARSKRGTAGWRRPLHPWRCLPGVRQGAEPRRPLLPLGDGKQQRQPARRLLLGRRTRRHLCDRGSAAHPVEPSAKLASSIWPSIAHAGPYKPWHARTASEAAARAAFSSSASTSVQQPSVQHHVPKLVVGRDAVERGTRADKSV